VRHTFVETEDSQLNDVLNKIQEKIIFPSFLPAKQRKLVFDPTKRTFMAQNPVIIEVDGEEYRFSPLDRFKDVPNSKKILNEALGKMKTPQDWRNLPILLAGYKTAQIKLHPNHYDKIIRVAGETGNIFEIIECAKQSNETNLHLNSENVAIRVSAYVNSKITESGWEAAQTKQAMKWNRVVLDLLHRPDRKHEKHLSILHSYVVRGLHLFTRACTIKVMEQAGEPVDQQLTLLRDDAELLRTLWESDLKQEFLRTQKLSESNPEASLEQAPAQIPKLTRLLPSPDMDSSIPDVNGLNGSMYVRVLAQNIKGVSVTKELLAKDEKPVKTGETWDKSLNGYLTTIEKTLQSHLNAFLAENDADGKRGWVQRAEEIINMELKPLAEPEASAAPPTEEA
jgi:Fe-S cluster biosynthesis and repair protein YggX